MLLSHWWPKFLIRREKLLYLKMLGIQMAPVMGRQAPKWRAVAFHPKTETIWIKDGEGKFSQWAELWAVWLMITQEPSPIVVCTDSRAIHQGLTLWLPTWYHANWMVSHRPLWGQKLWQDLWAKGQMSFGIPR